jgi:hypothetical protein
VLLLLVLLLPIAESDSSMLQGLLFVAMVS